MALALFGVACCLIFSLPTGPVILGRGKASDGRTIYNKTTGVSHSIFKYFNPDIFSGSSIWGFAPARGEGRKRKITLVHGVEIPILGNNYSILFQEHRLKGVELKADKLIVSHPYNRHHLLLSMWLKQKSLRFLAEQSQLFADRLDVTVGRITTKEVRSRWGSCSHQGNLSYSWRLIFAPEEVASYVCAHEVAHRRHMNHSREFWETVESICPDYKAHRQWLRINGQTLFLFN